MNIRYFIFCTLFFCSCTIQKQDKVELKKEIPYVRSDKYAHELDIRSSFVLSPPNAVTYCSSFIGGTQSYQGVYKITGDKVYLTVYDTGSSQSMTSSYHEVEKTSISEGDSFTVNCRVFFKDDSVYYQAYDYPFSIDVGDKTFGIMQKDESGFSFKVPKSKSFVKFKVSTFGYGEYEFDLFPLWDYNIRMYLDGNSYFFKLDKILDFTLIYRNGKLHDAVNEEIYYLPKLSDEH